MSSKWYAGKLLGKPPPAGTDEGSENTKVGALDTFIGKFSSDQRKDLSNLHGCMWELDDNVASCRECDVKFSITKRKHHCRACGGIFCEQCCREGGGTSKKSERTCGGCRRGETAGPEVKKAAELNCSTSGKNNARNAADNIELTVPAKYCPLSRGSLYPEEDDNSSNPVGSLGRANLTLAGDKPPLCGYFEIINKCENEVVAVKVLQPGNHNLIYEAPRPPYLALPPYESLNCTFDGESSEYIDVLLLYRNFNPIPASRRIVYDTSPDINTGLTVTNISPCASVSQFRCFRIVRIPCRGCNVLLKCKGDGLVELRKGSSVSRVGIFSKVVGGRKAGNENQLDFNTNAVDINLICDSGI